MPLLGQNLIGPKLAAGALAIFAGVYAVVLIYGLYADFDLVWKPFLVPSFFAMALTPFVALAQFYRVTDPVANRAHWPKIMAITMAAPALFWGYLIWEASGQFKYEPFADTLIIIGLAGGPAILSIWLMVTFILLARNPR